MGGFIKIGDTVFSSSKLLYARLDESDATVRIFLDISVEALSGFPRPSVVEEKFETREEAEAALLNLVV